MNLPEYKCKDCGKINKRNDLLIASGYKRVAKNVIKLYKCKDSTKCHRQDYFDIIPEYFKQLSIQEIQTLRLVKLFTQISPPTSYQYLGMKGEAGLSTNLKAW